MASEASEQKGVVVKSTGSWYTVRTDGAGSLIDCKVKGNFRLKGIRSTNPVAVGDRVSIVVGAEGKGFIREIEDRRNFIVRKASNLSKQSHILAANLDQGGTPRNQYRLHRPLSCRSRGIPDTGGDSLQ